MKPKPLPSFTTRLWRGLGFASLALLLPAFPTPTALGQGPSVRLSFKFILNQAGTRSGSGNINTDDEVAAQIARGNEIFSRFNSELRIENLEVVDVGGISQWYTTGVSEKERDDLRAAAMRDPQMYGWRGDAVNVYITAADASAISDFTPNNNIIVMGQGVFETTLAHEVGHILHLCHTHQSDVGGPCGGNDGCGDTLKDNQDWTQDDIALNNYGKPYDGLTDAGQRYLVDVTWGNLMSYHDPDNRSMLTRCQLDRLSNQAYSDRNWLLRKAPIYVDAGYTGDHLGSFTEPYQTIQQAIEAGGVPGRVLVLKQGVHPRPAAPLNFDVEIVTRDGPSLLPDAAPRFSLPYAVEQSANPAVREAMLRALRAGQKDVTTVLAHLREAERLAAGREKSAILLEIAQRLRDAARPGESAAAFREIAKATDQAELGRHALKKAEAMERQAARMKHDP